MLTLGLDISSSKIGSCILDEKENIIYSNSFIFKEKISLCEKAELFKHYIQSLQHAHNIEKVIIESPFISMGGGMSSAQTISTLLSFNGMCQFIIYDLFKIVPTMVDVRAARKLLGITIPRGIKKQTVKKQIIIDYVVNKYKDSETPFEYNLTKHGNYVAGSDDRADALVITLGGLKLEKTS